MKLQLTDRIVRMIEKADRKKLGLKTRDELISAAEVKSERKLHKQVAASLRMRDIVFFESRFDSRDDHPYETKLALRIFATLLRAPVKKKSARRGGRFVIGLQLRRLCALLRT
jgi:hypothetical protein